MILPQRYPNPAKTCRTCLHWTVTKEIRAADADSFRVCAVSTDEIFNVTAGGDHCRRWKIKPQPTHGGVQ